MEQERQDGYRTKAPEIFVLMMYSTHLLAILLIGIAGGWNIWTSFAVLVMFILCWIAYVRKFQNFEFRIGLYYICVMNSVCIFSIITGEFGYALVPWCCIVVILGISGAEGLLKLNWPYMIFLLFYHIVIRKNVDFMGMNGLYSIGIPVGNVLCLIVLVGFWMKKRKESSERLMQVIRELKIAEKSKDDFLANVSHEIRTPINTISGMSELALQEEDLAKMKDEILSIQHAGRNLMTVVSDILDFSELQSGSLEIVEEEYNITSTIHDVINMSMALKSEKHLEFIVDCDATLPRCLVGDEKKIRRVVMNLISNAIKFTNDGGVCVKIEHRKEGYGINLIISVIDTGIGMSKESVERLFTAYNQVDTSKSRKSGGVGLGIAISKAIVNAMGGVITVKSEVNSGTLMRVVIPQKVVNERPIVEIENKSKKNIMFFFDPENITLLNLRDYFQQSIYHMTKQLDMPLTQSRSLSELKRRMERENFDYVFIGISEYQEDMNYFNSLATEKKVIVALERGEENIVSSKNILIIYKPFYVLPVASVLKGALDKKIINKNAHKQSFIAPNVHVLVVDDNQMNIKVVRGLLGKYQLQVTEALNGFEALEKIDERCYDFVFMDHMMPEMDGIECLHRIREKAGTYFQKVPVIALTANAIAGAREMFLNEGFADFVEKPVENSVLERVLRRNIDETKLVWLDEDEELTREDTAEVTVATPGEGLVIDSYKAKDNTNIMEDKPANEELNGEITTLNTTDTEETVNDQAFAVGDLDVEMGQMYCGGQEFYISILEEYATKDRENWEPIEGFFAKEDWKNYTITVHGIKSSMLAIGATGLSEMAKALEMAGKAEDYGYIKDNHMAMVIELKRVIRQIQDSKWVSYEANSCEDTTSLTPISDDEFQEAILALENAMYQLDGSLMMEIVSKLDGCSYHGQALSKQIETVKHKIQNSDYMSAVEAVLQLHDRIKKQAAGGGSL